MDEKREKLASVLKYVSYKPDWKLMIVPTSQLLVGAYVQDTYSKEAKKIHISLSFPFIDVEKPVSLWLKFIRKCIITMECHEMDEWLKFKNRLPFNPHQRK